MTTAARPSYAALNPMGFPHYTDHLAAVACLMKCPLIFTDIHHYEQCLKLYPDVQAQLHDWNDFTAPSIVQNYDAIFVSDLWDSQQRHQRFKPHEEELGKKLTIVHCPHGFSDKGFWFSRYADQEATLVYGQNMLDLIQLHAPSQSLGHHAIVGNLRYSYYKQHQARLDQLVQEEVLSRFAKPQPTLLYAPTWRDSESSTSFFEIAEELLSQLPAQYNLIVKLHPNLEHDHDRMIHVFDIISRYEERPNITILSEFPLIYPLANACVAYIGDRSAVGYDILAFQKPMFFATAPTVNEQLEPLLACGSLIRPHMYGELFKHIEAALEQGDSHRQKQQELYDYTFAPEAPAEEVRDRIVQLIHRCQATLRTNF